MKLSTGNCAPRIGSARAHPRPQTTRTTVLRAARRQQRCEWPSRSGKGGRVNELRRVTNQRKEKWVKEYLGTCRLTLWTNLSRLLSKSSPIEEFMLSNSFLLQSKSSKSFGDRPGLLVRTAQAQEGGMMSWDTGPVLSSLVLVTQTCSILKPVHRGFKKNLHPFIHAFNKLFKSKLREHFCSSWFINLYSKD